MGRQVVFAGNGFRPPCIHRFRKVLADGDGLLSRGTFAEVDEETVRVAIDDTIAQRLNLGFASGQYFVATFGDRTREFRIVEATRGGTKHAIEGIHKDLCGQVQCTILVSLRLFPGGPDGFDESREYCRLP